MILFPPCKINLGLHIVRRRDDGFHDIETIFYPVPFHDILEAVPADDGRFSFTSSGIPVPGEPGDNLCVRAWRLLHKERNAAPVRMHLHKVIPMGSGLGGGSSDAASALILLNRLQGMNLSVPELEQYAARLGSDCPFFIRSVPSLATGRGEKLEPMEVSLKGYCLALVVPPVHVSTTEAYRGVKPLVPAWSLKELPRTPIEKWPQLLMNGFEKTVFRDHPVIGTVHREMYRAGALYAAMSGSGSSVFGIFRIGDEMPVSVAGYPALRFVW